MERRGFLGKVLGATTAAIGLGPARAATALATPAAAPALAPGDWAAVRALFPLAADHVHLALMLLTSHPKPVRDAIERHRRALDENPVVYFEERFFHAEDEVRKAAAAYTGGAPDDIALTDSTTMSLGVLYGGLALRPGDEVLTTLHDHFSTHESLRLRAARAGGVKVRKIALYDAPAAATADEMTKRLAAAIGPATRAVGVTWVHSSTGVKTPIQRFAEVVAAANRKRKAAQQILLCVDGVHGFGVEAESPAELGCDFFAAGCHKWLFGPRGTGVLWGRPAAWQDHGGLIAAFERGPYEAWMKGQPPTGPRALLATPGGFHSFEHRWALGEAFALHEKIGRKRIAARIHELAKQCKEGLARMPHVTLHTPTAAESSAALVCFDVLGKPAPEVVKQLLARKIVASVTPYATAYARFSPGILNSPAEIEQALAAVRALA